MVMNKSRGRPRGGSDAKDRILHAARQRFVERGYTGTTMRAIAADAKVDPALVSYHFTSKPGLFAATMALALGPSQVLAAALEGDPATVPERLLTAVMQTWDAPEFGRPLQALVATAMQEEDVMRVFREYLEREVVTQIANHLHGPGATSRATAAITLVVGLIFSRYILHLAPAADLAADELRRTLAPSLRVALDARLTRSVMLQPNHSNLRGGG